MPNDSHVATRYPTLRSVFATAIGTNMIGPLFKSAGKPGTFRTVTADDGIPQLANRAKSTLFYKFNDGQHPHVKLETRATQVPLACIASETVPVSDLLVVFGGNSGPDKYKLLAGAVADSVQDAPAQDAPAQDVAMVDDADAQESEDSETEADAVQEEGESTAGAAEEEEGEEEEAEDEDAAPDADNVAEPKGVKRNHDSMSTESMQNNMDTLRAENMRLQNHISAITEERDKLRKSLAIWLV